MVLWDLRPLGDIIDRPAHGRLLGEHSLPLSIALHLLPGAAIVLVYALVGHPVAETVGYPALFGFLVAAALVLVPWEFGLLLYLGRRRNCGWSLDGVVQLRSRLSRGRLAGVVTAICVWALIVAIGLSFVDDYLLERLFSWFPEHYQLAGFDPASHGQALFHMVTVINLLFFGLAAPFIEELYFRGFLLPRIPIAGLAKPVANSLLFVVYHFWSPWRIVTRLLFVVPMVYLTWKHDSIRVGIWAHCTLNCIGILLGYALMMSQL